MALPIIVAVQSIACIHMSERNSSTQVFRLLEAIHQKENPENVRTPGAHGELGPFQITLDVWRQHTLLPFTAQYACDDDVAQSVALKHIRWIENLLVKHGVAPSVFNIALAWNGGINDAYAPAHVSAAVFEYAQAVENLYKGIR
jgi:hypothetical protein